MLISAKVEEVCLDADSQFQIDYIVEYIERLESRLSDEQVVSKLSHAFCTQIKSRSILSAEELTMLTRLFNADHTM